MGVIHRAYDERLDRWVAVKQIRPDVAAVAGARTRFWREARAAAALNHPAIVQIYDVVLEDDGDWIVMELVEGATLAELIRAGPLDLMRALPLLRQIAEGLEEAHLKGILHRDLKTENVMVAASGQAKIMDFGLAEWLCCGHLWNVSEEVLGTPRCMSPEQIRGGVLDPRSDLFSLGILLYETLTGLSPFRVRSPLETLDRVCNHHPRPAYMSNRALPLRLSGLIDRLLQKDPRRRPRSARQVACVLRNLESHRAGSSPRAGAEREIPRPGRSLGSRVAQGTACDHQPTWVEIPRSPRIAP